MYTIVICLCLVFPALAEDIPFNLLERMQSSLKNTLANSIKLLELEVHIVAENMDQTLSEISSKYPFSLKPANGSDDKLIETKMPAAFWANQHEVVNDSEPANECLDLFQKKFSTKKEEVGECLKFQLHLISSHKQTLHDTLNKTIDTFEQLKTRSIDCDRNSTTIRKNMQDAWCVRKIELQVSDIAAEAKLSFSNMLEDVKKIENAWITNLFNCMTRNEESEAAPEYLRACGAQLDEDYNQRKT